MSGKKGTVCKRTKGPNQAGAYLRLLCSMKQLGVFLLSPVWDASPSQVYPQH